MRKLPEHFQLEDIREKQMTAILHFERNSTPPDQARFLNLLHTVSDEGSYLIDHKDKITPEKVEHLEYMFKEAVKIGKKAKDEKQSWVHVPNEGSIARVKLNHLKEHLKHSLAEQHHSTSPKR